MTRPDIVLVRATAHLPDGIVPGSHYWVDRNAPYISDALHPQDGSEPLLVLIDDQTGRETGDE